MLLLLVQNDRLELEPWKSEAECYDTDTRVFFGPTSTQVQGASTNQYKEEKRYYSRIAKSICSSCVVIEDCLRYAVENPSLTAYGVWGGHDEIELKRLRRRIKARARESKNKPIQDQASS